MKKTSVALRLWEVFGNRLIEFDMAFYRQLTALIDMYTSTEISEHLLPITLSLAEDKVAEVRHMAFRVVSRRSRLILPNIFAADALRSDVL